MDAQLVEATIKTYLTEIRNRLDKAAGIGRAADACAGAGFHEKGLEVALDLEQLLYEATTLLNAASLINRIRSTRLSGHFLSLLPAGACAFRGVAVVPAMMPHDLEGGFYEDLRYSTNDFVFGFATNRPCRGSACKAQRRRRKQGGQQALE